MRTTWGALAMIATCGLSASATNAQIITTIAGTDWHFPTGSLPAVNAPLGLVSGVAVDGTGNVFVYDSSTSIVVRISVNGTLNVVAGNGIDGHSGDGGPATSASFFSTGGLTSRSSFSN